MTPTVWLIMTMTILWENLFHFVRNNGKRIREERRAKSACENAQSQPNFTQGTESSPGS